MLQNCAEPESPPPQSENGSQKRSARGGLRRKRCPKHSLQILMRNSRLSGHKRFVHTQNTHTHTRSCVCARTTTETFPRQTHQLPAAVQSKQGWINVYSDGGGLFGLFRRIVNYFHTFLGNLSQATRQHAGAAASYKVLSVRRQLRWSAGRVGVGLLTFCKYTLMEENSGGEAWRCC